MSAEWTTQDAAEAWGVSVATVKRWAAQGRIKARKVRRDWVILQHRKPGTGPAENSGMTGQQRKRAPRGPAPYKPTSFSIPEPVKTALESMARERGVSRSALATEALTAWLKSKGHPAFTPKHSKDAPEIPAVDWDDFPAFFEDYARDADEWSPLGMGVYAIYDGENCVYVGSSQALSSRLQSHPHVATLLADMRPCRVLWLPVKKYRRAERVLLDAWDPPLNKQSVRA